MGGVQTYKGHPNMRVSKHAGASKHMGGVQPCRGTSKHTGGIQTYGGVQTYRRYPDIWGIQTYGGCPNIWGYPNIWGIQTYRGHPNIQGPSCEVGFAISVYKKVESGSIINPDALQQEMEQKRVK